MNSSASIKELATAEKAMSISYFVDTGALESRKIQNMQKPQLTESMEEFMNKNSSKIIEALTFLAVKHAYDNGLPRYVDFKLNAVSSLTQTTLRVNCQVFKNYGTGSITAQ